MTIAADQATDSELHLCDNSRMDKDANVRNAQSAFLIVCAGGNCEEKRNSVPE